MTKKITEISAELITKLNFCVFDLETTGGNHKNDRIIEIGLVRLENLKIVKEKNILINPQIKIPDFIQKLTSIRQADVADSPLIEEVIDEIIEFMGDDILVAHNTSFDVPFFNSVLRRLGKAELENNSICTNLMTKYLIPNLLNSNLNYMSKIFDISHEKAHRALDDAMATAKLLQKYLQIFINKGINKVNHLYYPRNRYELDRTHFKSDQASHEEIIQSFRKLKTPSLFTIKGENGIILFSLPCLNTDEEAALIEKKLKEENWETITIKLTGPFVEALINFNLLFNKLPQDSKNEILTFLWEQHLKGHKRIKVEDSEEDQQDREGFRKIEGDFIITNHLVPEQYIIYPIESLHHKSELVFRYPGHKKKLIQYIKSKSSRISQKKLKKTHIQANLREFILNYINKCQEKNQDIYVFSKEVPLKKEEYFFKDLEDFLLKQPNTYQYPKEYI